MTPHVPLCAIPTQGSVKPSFAILCCLLMFVGSGATHAKDVNRLKSLSLEALADIEVSIATGTPQKPKDIAAAVYVIPREQIARSTATSIPELLRLVPGVSVGRIDANKWSITTRGFGSRFANKLLVLIDGRSVYNSLYSGVLWDAQDVLLEDIERIEVIRGPGASIWGANAVNGVINIITRSAAETRGNLIVAGAGDEERGFVSVRHGGNLGNGGAYRVYAKHFDRDGGHDHAHAGAKDDWDSLRGGFRIDWGPESAQTTLQGDVYDVDSSQAFASLSLSNPPPNFVTEVTDPMRHNGANLLFRHKKRSDRTSSELLFYYDHTQVKDPRLEQTVDAFDLRYSQERMIDARQTLQWGVGYRHASDRATSRSVSFNPENRSLRLWSAFLQDRITFADDNVELLIGSKLEHNDYTGFEFQPTIRGLFHLDRGTTLWAAVSRAVRTPSRIEDEAELIIEVDTANAVPAVVTLNSDGEVDAEQVMAWEIGWRKQWNTRVSAALSAFYNDYKNLQNVTILPPSFVATPIPHLEVATSLNNAGEAEVYGAELEFDWSAASGTWGARVGYSWNDYNGELTVPALPTPQQQLTVMTYHRLRDNWDLSLTWRYVDQLPDQSIEDYLTLDARLDWQVTPAFKVSVMGRNLLDASHPEATDSSLSSRTTEVQRDMFITFDWRF